MEKTFKVRDLRKKEQFIIDDSYLNGYAKIFGPSGTAVYLSLCRRANKDQFCFPSEKTIADDHNITDRTARTHIKRLVEARIVRVKRERSESGKWRHNVYYLLDKSEWKTPEEIISFGRHRKLKTNPAENNGTDQRKQIPPKESHGKDAQSKDSASPSANADSPQIRKGNTEPVSLTEAVAYFKRSPGRHIQIIGDYAKAKKPDCRTGGQWHTFMKRNLRAANELAEFSDEQIEVTAKKIWGEEWLKHWTLETLLKYLINNH